MMLKQLFVTLIIFHMAISQANAQASGYFYRIKHQDTITNVLYRINLRPVYGKNGVLAQTLKMNPRKRKQDGNSVYPNEIIRLPVTDPSVFLGRAKILDSGEVIFHSAESVANVEASPVTIVRGPSNELEMVDSHFTAALGVGYFRLDGQDLKTKGTTKILSNASPTLDLAWHLDWDKKNVFVFNFHLQQYSLQPLNDEQSYAKDKGVRTGVSATYMHRFDNFVGSFGLTFNEEFFLFANSPTELSVEKKMIMGAALGGSYDIFKKKNGAIGAELNASYLMPTSTNCYSIESGYKAEAGFYFRHDKSYDLHIDYRIIKQDTSLATKEENQLSFKFIYHFGSDS